MSQNFEIARLFYEMASLLEGRDESGFRVRAYQRGAQVLEALSEGVAAVAARGGLNRCRASVAIWPPASRNTLLAPCVVASAARSRWIP